MFLSLEVPLLNTNARIFYFHKECGCLYMLGSTQAKEVIPLPGIKIDNHTVKEFTNWLNKDCEHESVENDEE